MPKGAQAIGLRGVPGLGRKGSGPMSAERKQKQASNELTACNALMAASWRVLLDNFKQQ